MKHYLVITPDSLIDALLSESRRLMKDVYERDVELLYYRMQTKQTLDNPRRIFIKGDGQVIEAEVKPHITLVQNIELENASDFVHQAKAICSSYKPFELEYKGVGNYGMDFTFYVAFKRNEILEEIRERLLEICRDYMSAEAYDQHIADTYVPHATVIYDDIDSEKVLQAYDLLDRSKFSQGVSVGEIVLWGASSTEDVVARFKLG